MIYEGSSGGSVELADFVLIIKRKGLVSALSHGAKGDKRVPYSSITSVQFKEPGLTTGYIQFGVAGGVESRGGIVAAGSDENTVLFLSSMADDFRELRDEVERRVEQAKGGPMLARADLSVADELTKLADLRDRGVLDEAEFATQKRTILAGASAATGARRDRAVAGVVGGKRRPGVVAPSSSAADGAKSRTAKFGFGCLSILGLIVLAAAMDGQAEISGGQETPTTVSNQASADEP